MTIPTESKCSKNVLHDWWVVIDNDEFYSERCKFCFTRVDYNRIGGRIDNVKHYLHNLRSTLQPYGSMRELYYKVYGCPKVIKKPVKKDWDEGIQETKDLLKYWNKKPSQDPWNGGNKVEMAKLASGNI